MKKSSDNYIYSPTDLCIYQESHYASWMDRYHLDFPKKFTPDNPSEDQKIIIKKGIEHEKNFLNCLRANGHTVIEIPTHNNPFTTTLASMQQGAEFIYQACLKSPPFEGYADFLVKVPGPSKLGDYHYEVWDTKLGRKPKPYYLLQLCSYADMLEHIQGRRPEWIRVVLGTGETHPFRTDDTFYYYKCLRASFVEFMEAFSEDVQPIPQPGRDHRRWTSHAEAHMERVDHLNQTANITTTQIKRLEVAGITTMTALANTGEARVSGIQDDIYQRLREQATLQIASRHAEVPKYRVVPPSIDNLNRGLLLLPPPSPADVFFDIEGYPLVQGGLEYLFGVTYIEKDNRKFIDWWAHDSSEEKRAFEDFIDWVHSRWKDNPRMHIYHYASYEVSAMRRLMSRHATREHEVDTLLRNNVFVDLYTITRQGIRVGAPSYSIKQIENLYRDKREGDVTTSVGSIVFYERWLESDEPRDWKSSPILKQIRDYNRDDCDSTHMLHEWLLERQQEAGITYFRQDEDETIKEAPEDVSEAVAHRHELSIALLERADERRDENPDAARIDKLLAHLVEFHRREAKPVFWSKYDRAEMTEDELMDDLNCLGGLTRTDEPPVAVKKSTGFWYKFDPAQDTKICETKSVFFAHDLKISVKVEKLDQDQGRILLKLGRTALERLDKNPDKEPPGRVSLIPDEYVNPNPIPEAVETVVEEWLQNERLPSTMEAFLHRRRPDVDDDGTGDLVKAGEDTKEAAIRLVGSMRSTTLCIQGPPGSGKTTGAAEVILSLIKNGKKVAITSNSHKAILNLMQKCAQSSNDAFRCLKVGGDKNDPLFSEYEGAVYEKDSKKAAPLIDQFPVVGGTAWFFCREDVQNKFDTLFVDEAGQVSVANLVGMSQCAENIVLLGDQMQLSQPTQGAHPGESGLSILDYYLEGRPTIPPDLGIFLGQSWRMHPALCAFISGAFYEGRLTSGPQRENRIIRCNPDTTTTSTMLVPKEAGILFVPVEHDGNTQGSEEEAEVVHQIVEELLQREHTDLNGNTIGRLKQEDILVVAPYNMQRLILQSRLPDKIPVGTVDKFQGQEAPVVIVSMCASDGASTSRGIKFLFERNRLNVALSRASSLAIVVGNPGLVNMPCGVVENMGLVNLYCRILDEGQRDYLGENRSAGIKA